MNEIEEMRNSDLVQEKDLGNGIHSFNFTRKCFNKKQWNDMTVKARGLFIDIDSNKVLARSFDKFFAIGERPETQLPEVLMNTVYPVNVYEKYNGFLGILSAGKDGHLFAASKSTDKGEFAEYFKTILMNHFEFFNINENKLYHYLQDNNLSLVFEVIDPEHDPHIVQYHTPDIVLLEGVYNSIECYRHIAYDSLIQIANYFNFNYKKKACQINNDEDFLKFLDYTQTLTDIEGFVLEDSIGHMYKVKTDWYQRWKFIRSIMERIINGKPATSRMDKYTFEIIEESVKLFQDKIGRDPKSVIELRKFLEDMAGRE